MSLVRYDIVVCVYVRWNAYTECIPAVLQYYTTLCIVLNTYNILGYADVFHNYGIKSNHGM